MSVNSELAALNSLGNMSLEGSIADRGVTTGVLSSGHGVSFDGDATNSLGRISDAGSVHYAERSNYVDPSVAPSKSSPNFTGSLGRFSADGSDA